MASIEVVGGIKAEIKNEAEDEEVVEIGLNDISKDESDSDPFDVGHYDSDNENFDYVQDEVLGQASESQGNLSNHSQMHNKNQEKGGQLKINDEKEDHCKGGKHFKTTANLNVDETLVLDNTNSASMDLLDDVNKQRLKRRKVNRKQVGEGKETGNSVTNQKINDEKEDHCKGGKHFKTTAKLNVDETLVLKNTASASTDLLDDVNKQGLKRRKVKRKQVEEGKEAGNSVTNQKINDEKEDHCKGGKHFKTTAKLIVDETPVLNDTASASTDLLDDVNKQGLKRREVNRKQVEEGKEAGNSVTNQVDLSEIYPTNKQISILEDILKAYVTRVPTSSISPTEYTVKGLDKFMCNHCWLLTNNKKNLAKHIRYMHRDVTKIYHCPYCPHKEKFTVRKHVIAKHIAEYELECFSISSTEYTVEAFDKLICNYCQLLTGNRKDLENHIRNEHKDREKMTQCHKTKRSLKRHIIAKPKAKDEFKRFSCAQCSYKCKLKARLANHMNSHLHPSQMMDRMKKCVLCPKMYKRNEVLQRHVLNVHNRHKVTKLKCPECDYECTERLYLRNHQNAWHSNREDLETLLCHNCTFKTKFKHNLYLHMQVKHAKYLFQCHKCAYQTNTRGSLNIHLIGHQEVKNEVDLKYRCDKCDYKTYRMYSLQVHKLNHLKPEEIQFFYCYHCDFKAKRKDNLKTHVLRHFKYGEVTFQCYICDFTTKKRHKLVQHVDRHSKGTIDMENGKTEVTKSEERENKKPTVNTNTNKKKNTGQKKNRKRKAMATTGQAKVMRAPKSENSLKTELYTATEQPSDEAKSPKDEVMSLVKPLRRSARLRKELKESPES